jgi:hypothetical protein
MNRFGRAKLSDTRSVIKIYSPKLKMTQRPFHRYVQDSCASTGRCLKPQCKFGE